MEVHDPGSIKIIDNEIIIKTFNGTNQQNIYHLVAAFDIYESLDNYTMTADFEVVEGTELLNYLPAAGEEMIELSIKTPDRKTIRYEFFVESITNLQSNDMSNLKTYLLRCVTKDAMKNSYMVYTKRYRDMEYDSAAQEIIKKDLASSKSIEVEKTKGFFDYTVNRVRPFQAMNLLTERSVSARNLSSEFIFYEDNEMYRFLTIENLIETRIGRAENFKYNYVVSNMAREFGQDENYRNILRYEVLDQGDSMNKIKLGAHKNRYVEFDILHGDYFKRKEYTNTVDYQKFKKTDGNYDVHSTAFNTFAETEPAYTRLLLKDSTRPEMFYNDNAHYKAGFREKIYHSGVRVRVYGDTELMVGDVITLDLPEITETTQERKLQPIHSGKFLVRQIRHLVNKHPNGSGRFEHFMILDCRRPNLKKAIG